MLLAVFSACLCNDHYHIFIQFIDWFFTCKVLYVISFHFNYCSWFVCGCFYKKWCICLFLTWLLSNTEYIDWLFTCFDLYVIWLHLDRCSMYVNACLTGSSYFVWLRNNYNNPSNSLIGSLHYWSICCIFSFELL